jgi:hypothetical protein
MVDASGSILCFLEDGRISPTFEIPIIIHKSMAHLSASVGEPSSILRSCSKYQVARRIVGPIGK